jgi:hypothetical protein
MVLYGGGSGGGNRCLGAMLQFQLRFLDASVDYYLEHYNDRAVLRPTTTPCFDLSFVFDCVVCVALVSQ